MGRTIIEPKPIGDNCGVCWGLGLPFGSGVTPSVITAIVSKIEKGALWLPGDGEPVDGTFALTQTASCTFLFFSPTFRVRLRWFAVVTPVSVTAGGIPQFNSFESGPCDLVLRGNPDPVGRKFFAGNVEIFL